MASAEVSKSAVEVALRLSEDEAQFLLYVLGTVGGDPTRSPRRHQRAISNALRTVLAPDRAVAERLAELKDGAGLYFKNDDTFVTTAVDKYRWTA